MIKRYLEEYITEDLSGKMVFISGPRQVGKTTLSLQVGKSAYSGKYGYLNWDNKQDRKLMISGALPADKRLLIFDEIHKYRKWKNYLKGEYDKHKDKIRILVTGSARLDIYKKGGDSLLGRYHPYKLHPLSLGEVSSGTVPCEPFKELKFTDTSKHDGDLFDALFKFGGFPEVFLKGSERELRRWHNERADRLIKEDIRDIENVRDISALQILVELLPEKAGSLFSLNSLREDLGVTHKTVSLWVDILERFYYHFRIYPFQASLIKSLRKEPKLYLWDYSEIKDENIRLENMIASHLLKFCDFLSDTEGYKCRLYFLRDKEQREVDFLVAVDKKPWFCVEVKSTFKKVPASLKYFTKRLKIPYAFLAVKEKGVDQLKSDIRIISADKFLKALV